MNEWLNRPSRFYSRICEFSVTRRVQYIMQNLQDAMDYASIPNTEIHSLGTIITGLIEQPEVESVQLAKLPIESGGYQYTIRYKGYDTARTDITVCFTDHFDSEEKTIINEIVADLSRADLMEIVGWRFPATKKETVEQEDNHGTDGTQE